MRALLFVLAASAATTPVLAQTSPKPSQSADEIVCKLLPEGCGSATYSDDQRISGPSAKQDFTFTPKKANAAVRPAETTARVATTAAVRRDLSPAASPIGRRAAPMGYTPTRPRAGTPSGAVGAQRGFDMRVNFELGSATLTSEGRVQADEFAKALLNPKMSGLRFRIEGHTDAMGTRADNLQLAKARADAVAQYLADKGVAKDRFETAGYGFDRPLNRSRPLSAVNRRVEIAVAK